MKKTGKIKEKIMLPALIFAGLVMGVLAKAGDVIVQGFFLRDLIAYFGVLTSGFGVWVFICVLISIKSENAKLAAVNVPVFLSAMLFSYYLYSYFVVHYFYGKAVIFWVAMILPSALAARICHDVLNKPKLKILILIADSVISIYSILEIEGAGLFSITVNALMFLCLVWLLYRKPRTESGN